jgi:hypothetical protein
MKSLGQIAYEAFGSHFPGHIPWEEQNQHGRDVWGVVGLAVAEAVAGRPDRVVLAATIAAGLAAHAGRGAAMAEYRTQYAQSALDLADEIIKLAKETP